MASSVAISQNGFYRHFDIGGLDAGAVRFHAHLHIGVDHPFDGDGTFIWVPGLDYLNSSVDGIGCGGI